MVHAAPPVGIVAAVKARAASEGVPVVALSQGRTLRIVVRLSRPVAQLREGVLVPLVRTLSGAGSWQLTAVGPSGGRLRLMAESPHGGKQWIRKDLDGCDPSFQVLGRPVMPLFASDPRCAGDPAADPAHPVDVGGARIGHAFPLALATRGLRVFALVNGILFASRPGFYPSPAVGQATLRSAGALVVSLRGTLVPLRPS